jgi:hypothetical protein
MLSLWYAPLLTNSADSKNGATANVKKKTTFNSLMRLTHRWTFLRGCASSGIEVCDRSVPARGIRTRTCRGIMHAFSSLKTSSVRSALSKEEQKRISLLFRCERCACVSRNTYRRLYYSQGTVSQCTSRTFHKKCLRVPLYRSQYSACSSTSIKNRC